MHVNLHKLRLGLVGIVVATTLFFTFMFSGRSRARFEAARGNLDADCARWVREGGTRSVCDPSTPGASLFPRLKDGRAKVSSASLALARGDEAAAERELAGALDVVTELDRMNSEVAVIMSASLLRQALTVIETEMPNGGSGQEMKARLLAGRRLRSVAHPLRAHRLAATRAILDAFDKPVLRGLGLRMVADEEARTAAMERAIALGDTEGCIAADQGRSWLWARYAGIAIPNLCSHFVEVAQTGKRLDRARKAALRSPPRPAALVSHHALAVGAPR